MPKISEALLSNADEAHFRVMRLVEQCPNITQREVAERLGISLGRVNYCLSALIEKGWVKVQNFQASETKWRYAYVLTPNGLAQRAAMTARFLTKKLAEYEALKSEIEGLQGEMGV